MTAEPDVIKRNHPQFETLFRARDAEVYAESCKLAGPSLAERLARLPVDARDAAWTELDAMDRVRLSYAWEFWARPKQRPFLRDGRIARIILWLAGRGFGKSLTASQRIRERVEAGALNLAIIGPTLTDIGKYQINGESGIIAAFPPHQRPIWKEDKRLVVFHTGALGHVITAEEPEWRGGNMDSAWWDELAKSKYREKMWDNLEFNLRSAESGLDVEILITTTPTPIAQLKELVLDPDCLTIVGESTENAANLERRTLARWARKYKGTRLGQQEMGGRILVDNPDALFSRLDFEKSRVMSRDLVPPLLEVAVAIDPAIATNTDNDPTAIAAGGIDANGDVWIFTTDAERWSPEEWGARTIEVYDEAQANCIVGERNRGGDLVASNVRAALRAKKRGTLSIVDVIATRGKQIRAEPVAAMAEQLRIHFVGVHEETENEMCEWNPKLGLKSPNRLDAVVWLVYHLAKLSEDGEEDHSHDWDGIAEANMKLRREPTPLVVTSATDPRPIARQSQGPWSGGVI